jgi:hypothetical protein
VSRIAISHHINPESDFLSRRYISLESKYWPSMDKYRSFAFFQSHPPSIEMPSPTPYAFSRLFQASDILSAIQKAVSGEIPGGSFIIDEVPALFKIIEPFRNTLAQEVPQELKVYSSSWAIFNMYVHSPHLTLKRLVDSVPSGLLLLQEKDLGANPAVIDPLPCLVSSNEYKEQLILEIFEVVQPFVKGNVVLNFQLLPPFIMHLVYKGAAILTERFRIGEISAQCIKMLKSMRGFLKLISTRWAVACRS